MVTDAVVSVLMGFLTGVLSLLPSWELPASFAAFGPELGAKIDAFNGVLPVVTLGQCLAAMVGFRLFVLAWGLVVWLYDKIPFKAT
jgi:hypothetical protein